MKRLSTFITRRAPATVGQRCDSDPQKDAYYAMERAMIGPSIECEQDIEHLRRVSKYVCRKFRCSSVAIIEMDPVPPGCQRTFGFQRDGAIQLNAGFHGLNIGVLAHELAHHVTEHHYPLAEDHGARFAGCHRQILDSLNILPLCAYDAMAEEWGVNWEQWT